MALPEILRRILVGRLAKYGNVPEEAVTDDEIERFLNPALGDLARPDELPGVTEAAKRIISAVRRGRKIVVFGDYDCDGICATAIMMKTLRALKADVWPFIPNRRDEGYGMSEAAVDRMRREHPRVGMVITVDNGINSVQRVTELKRGRDIEMIVTDHHLPGDTLPDCTVVNPKVAAPPHLNALCGAAVAYFVANAVIRDARQEGLYDGPKIAGELLVLAGIATVTDIMPLLGQNRIFVSGALRLFHEHAPEGLRELYWKALRSVPRVGMPVLTAKDFGFLIGPRINAAGRVSRRSQESLDLILAEAGNAVTVALERVLDCNEQRRALEQSMAKEAEDLCRRYEGAPAYVLELSGDNQGVSGIVAARMLERQEGAPVPVCVIVQRRGSARAPDGYNMREAFMAAADALEDYGGHAAAGGFTIKPGRSDDFRRLFGEACVRQRQAYEATLAKGDGTGADGRHAADAVIRAETLTLEFAEALKRLEPFGEGNPEPLFRLCGVTLSDVRAVAAGRHLSLSICQEKCRLRAVWWGAGAAEEEYRSASGIPFDVDFHIEISDFQSRHVELRIVRLSPVR